VPSATVKVSPSASKPKKLTAASSANRGQQRAFAPLLTADTKHPQHAVVPSAASAAPVWRKAQVGDAASRRPVHVEQTQTRSALIGRQSILRMRGSDGVSPVGCRTRMSPPVMATARSEFLGDTRNRRDAATRGVGGRAGWPARASFAIAELNGRSLRRRLAGGRYDLCNGVTGDGIARECLVGPLHGAIDRSRQVTHNSVSDSIHNVARLPWRARQDIVAAKQQDAHLILLAERLGELRLLGIAIARKVERALGAGVEIECDERLRLAV